MLENLESYQKRTEFMWNSLPDDGSFCTNQGLVNKVTEDGIVKPFYGDTVIFFLDEEAIQWLADIQNELYKACGWCLAQKLNPETFHITLHDLKSDPYRMPEGMKERREKTIDIIQDARKTYRQGIAVNSRCMFSMVGTSIVMGFEPKTEDDCMALMTLYEKFQEVVPLSYPLTLHVTLAYYKPGVYKGNALNALQKVFQEIGREKRECHLDMMRLRYSVFENMNCYLWE